MAAISPSLLWCHFLQTYHYLHLFIYLAVHKRGPDSLLPTIIFLNHIVTYSPTEGAEYFSASSLNGGRMHTYGTPE